MDWHSPNSRSSTGTLKPRDENTSVWNRHATSSVTRAQVSPEARSVATFANVGSPTQTRRVMNPVLHVQSPDYFKKKQAELNRVLSFEGLRLSDEGKLEPCKQARTITDAEAAADQLRRKLIERGVHPDVLKFCRAELVQGNYFHAVLEAAKSVAQKIRDKTGLTSDGGELVDEAFGIGKKAYPVLAFNSLSTDSEQSEHKGLMNLMKGFFGTFRNPTAHAPRISWKITEQDALDMMTVASLLHRRLDEAVKTGA